MIVLLYCITPQKLGDWGRQKQVPRTPFLENMNKELYTESSPIWNQELRKMFAETIHRPTPKDEDFLRDSHLPKGTSSQPLPKSAIVTPIHSPSPGVGFSFYQPYSSSTRSKTKSTTVPTYSTSFRENGSIPKQGINVSLSGLKRVFDTDEEDIDLTNIKKEPKLNTFQF